MDALFDGSPSHAASLSDTSAGHQGYNGHRDGGSDDSPLLAVSKGAHISVVDVNTSPSLGVAEKPGCARVATGEIRSSATLMSQVFLMSSQRKTDS